MKKLIAYSSVAHMGFVTMGLFTMTPQGIQGAMFQMISHGLVSGRALPVRRRHLRPHAHPRDRGLWRAREPHAALCGRADGVRARQCRPARHLGLRRRVPRPPGRLPGESLGRLLRDDRRHPVGALHALALQPRDVRAAGEAGLQGDRRPRPARDRDPVRRSSCSSSITASCPARCSTASRPRPRRSSGLPGGAVGDEDRGARPGCGLGAGLP